MRLCWHERRNRDPAHVLLRSAVVERAGKVEPPAPASKGHKQNIPIGLWRGRNFDPGHPRMGAGVLDS